MARGRRGGPGWWRPVLVIVVPVVAATIAAVMVLSRVLDVASSGGRLDMIRTALAVGAGSGAVMTLVLGWRRQWSTEHDASERRLTELYVKAVEQLARRRNRPGRLRHDGGFAECLPLPVTGVPPLRPGPQPARGECCANAARGH
ncbi:hypothetical protein [Actinokineospora enzanensis]|uniref:hypothetical protein n=1 Tax=Actinokineospora enzanensis TaxID=155975 RepID=UPI0012EC1D5A|nr:hypothetical protein [Actinokineospora enzanensis]